MEIMEKFVLGDIPIETTFNDVLAKLKIEEQDDVEFAGTLFEKAKKIARPKVMCRIAAIDAINDDKVTISGITFTSEILSKNLKNIHNVFAYVATCGAEVDEWSHQEKDFVVAFWLDMIKELFLRGAITYFFHHLEHHYDVKKIATMNPGSGNVDTWPITQQKLLFELIGDVTKEISVVLTDTFLMLPTKSSSGIVFPSEKGFVNCAMCGRANCQNRRAAYNPSIEL
jgi:hypothetical protein